MRGIAHSRTELMEEPLVPGVTRSLPTPPPQPRDAFMHVVLDLGELVVRVVAAEEVEASPTVPHIHHTRCNTAT